MLRKSTLCVVKHKELCQRIRPMSSLLCSKGLIGGQWVPAISGQTFDVKNPANGQIIGSVPNMNEKDAQLAIDAAKKAFYSQEWTSLTAKQRSQLLKVLHIAII